VVTCPCQTRDTVRVKQDLPASSRVHAGSPCRSHPNPSTPAVLNTPAVSLARRYCLTSPTQNALPFTQSKSNLFVQALFAPIFLRSSLVSIGQY
jgi:hypothetical protein